MSNIYQYSCHTVSGEKRPLSDLQGQVLLIVNTASKCGFTPQFSGLETLYQQFKEKNFNVLGFPCNQFGHQDPGSNNDIQEFCQLNYGVSFPMYAKINVNGNRTDPLFKHLKEQAPGIMGSGLIKWNFTKFLINAQGEVVKRYAPTTKPETIVKDIEKLLA